MQTRRLPLLLSVIFCIGPAAPAEQDILLDTIRSRTDSALIEESTAVEQARTRAQSSGFTLELRPEISDTDKGVALRLNLPGLWNITRLRERLTVAARSEQLRVAALEWQDILSVYRSFCTYRMLQKQVTLTEEELSFIKPWLEQADRSVELRQLAVSDRARLYSSYLALLNDSSSRTAALLDVKRRLLMALGPDADLETLSAAAVIPMPSRLEAAALLPAALEQRADYRRLGEEIRATQLAEKAARSEDGFRVKYVQSAYREGRFGESDSWEVSAAIAIPLWGARNPDIALYHQQQLLARAEQTQQRQLIEERLRVLLNICDAYSEETAGRDRRLKPVIEQLNADLQQITDVPLKEIRTLLAVREQILDASLQTAESECRSELLAIDLAGELGGWQQHSPAPPR
jgi:hypothetical protein